MGKRIVIALGGNALGKNLPEQMEAVQHTARAIVDLIEQGNEVIVVHGNGPQVGMIANAMTELTRSDPQKYIPCPLSVCGAMSQGYIGYDLQNAVRAELVKRGIYKTASTIITQVMVDPYDESFYNPIKCVGKLMNAEEARKEEENGNHVEMISDGVFQRVVSSPTPKSIVEIDAIKALLDADQVVIACGGGGIPVLRQGNNLKGAAAVIEKDRAELCGDFCRGCGYCMPCPVGIEINDCARMSLLLRRSPAATHLSPEGQAKMKKIEDCLHCNQCRNKCPYGLDTPALLARNYEDYKRVLAGEVKV